MQYFAKYKIQYSQNVIVKALLTHILSLTAIESNMERENCIKMKIIGVNL